MKYTITLTTEELNGPEATNHFAKAFVDLMSLVDRHQIDVPKALEIQYNRADTVEYAGTDILDFKPDEDFACVVPISEHWGYMLTLRWMEW